MTPDSARRIDEALRSLAPPWVRTGVRVIDAADLGGMWPGERAAMARAVAARRSEFATGRALLRDLIGEDVEIGVGADRRPDLPVGFTGTLAHDHEIVVAATATRPTCRALGVDIEPVSAVAHDEARLILGAEELHLDPHLVFVLKEAVYKAWSSLGGGMLEHHEVVVEVDESEHGFVATVGSGAATFAGRYVAVEDRHLALVIVDSASAPACPTGHGSGMIGR